MWMHNGGLGGWKYIKRRLADRLADKWYLGVQGGTDSEWAFALFLDTLERLGHDPSSCPEKGFGPTVLRKAIEQTIALINEMTDSIPKSVIQNEDVDTRSLLNFAVTDGHSVICTRYISSAKDEAASLYYSSGTQWATRTSSPNDREYQMERKDKGADIVLVASEPLTFERGESLLLAFGIDCAANDMAENWVNVPTNSIITIHRQTVMMHPILDKFYERDPYHVRSSAFVQAKGLVSNEKAPASDTNTPSIEGHSEHDNLRKMIAGANSGRSLSPDLARRSLNPAAARESRGTPLSQQAPNLSSAKATAALGNIKVKRISIQQDGSTQDENAPEDVNSDTYEPASADVRNPRKLSQFFPELTLTSDNAV